MMMLIPETSPCYLTIKQSEDYSLIRELIRHPGTLSSTLSVLTLA